MNLSRWRGLPLAMLCLMASALVQAGPFKSLDYLYSISGKQTVAGHHNREPNADPARWTDTIYVKTGKFPAMWSGDFLFQQDNIANRWTMINEAKRQWQNGALINIMWHACNPAKSQPCGWDSNGLLSRMSDWEWSQLLTNGTPINSRWKQMMDDISVYLQDLENNGVEVMFRPLHEMNQGMFWWGGRPGANGTRKLYQLTHDYLTRNKGLSNLIWVWDMQDFGTLVNDLNTYNPGSAYWDVAALDIYEGFATWKYNAMVNISGGKPIAIGETDKLPSPERLAAEPRWTFFMAWAELPFQVQNDATIQRTYYAGNVVTLDEMPGWDGPENPMDPNIAYRRPVTTSSTETGYAPANATDADGNTRWASAYTNSEWIYVDLGATYDLTRVKLAWEAAYASTYYVQVSDDASTWRTIWGTSGGDGGIDEISLEGRGRFVRVHGTQRATSYGYSLYEFEVYGTASDTRSLGLYPGTTYRISARHSGKLLDVAGGTGATSNGSNVQQWVGNGQTNQQWILVDAGDGYSTLVSVNSGKALDVADSSTTDGGNTQIWSSAGAANQQWRIENLGDGYYRLINRHSGKALDVEGGAGMIDDGANVQQWTPNGQTNQHWRFERVVAP
ncbi:RICIN domain-containing protein [Allohahella marinimesophila]|uniref:Uncharacterized protein n=1 Tax=Allohahella marinimesophila TaxID=1054972 RepID=A0ABP7PBF8_9GAMM